MVGVAVNVTDVPAQILPEGIAAMLTLAARTGSTDIVIGLEVAGLPVIQVALDIITTVIISLLANVAEV